MTADIASSGPAPAPPPVPAQVFDPDRLAAVRATGLLDTPAEEPFDRLARLASTLLDAPLAFVTVVDDRRSFWKSCIGVDATDLAERQNQVEQSFCQYVIGTQEPLIVDDAARDPRTRGNPSIAAMGVAAWAGFPVHSPDGQVLGTFCVVDTRVRAWSERDVNVLSTLSLAASGEIALRVALGEAHRASQLALEAGESNAELARTLQESLLPPHLQSVPGLDVAARYLAAGSELGVTGDFYDVFHARGSSWGIVIGDVCGHGAAAATLTALSRYAVSSLASREPSPRKVLRQLNKAIRERSTREHDERFVTAAYLTLRPGPHGHFTGRISTAGHPAVLRLSANGELAELGRPGSLLGPMADPELGDERFNLDPGDLLLLYTDGVTEARARRGGEEFGAVRLWNLLRDAVPVPDAAGLASHLVDVVLAHSRRQLQDDLAIVVVRAPT